MCPKCGGAGLAGVTGDGRGKKYVGEAGNAEEDGRRRDLGEGEDGPAAVWVFE
jgi:hypothetical protein